MRQGTKLYAKIGTGPAEWVETVGRPRGVPIVGECLQVRYTTFPQGLQPLNVRVTGIQERPESIIPLVLLERC